VLVLNLANPVNPGGGVRRGAQAQEEDLCRKSSLLLSLESPAARKYYEYNYRLHSNMGSDAIILNPNVEIIKDENGKLLEDSVVVSVMTCAAPVVLYGFEGLSEHEYEELLYKRITGMLTCAAYWGYKLLVLGAFGCGAFGNDAHLVSDIFYKALKEFEFNGMHEKDFFRRIEFAVLSRSEDQYNFREFYRNFSYDNFFRDENAAETARAESRKKEREVYLDKIRGCMMGGAIGDALGYTIEFMDENSIFRRYGEKGIQEYELDSKTGKALISDDTQMSLFTATGIMYGDTRGCMRGVGANPYVYVSRAYDDWLRTQTENYETQGGRLCSWLMDVPELFSCRAPGNTCLSALQQQRAVGDIQTTSNPKNNSKGCGGIMRVAPLALYYPADGGHLEYMDREGAEIAAITHGHSLGYMPAAVLTHIIERLVYGDKDGKCYGLMEAVTEARDTAAKVFEGDKHLRELTDIINLAIELSENDDSDLDNIHRLGEGWIAEETLAIALYCSLKHQDDFSAGVTAAVNHKGDSDSTGAVTGNILGALLGYDAIDEKWKQNLEIADVILEIADDLCHHCQMDEYSHYVDPDWVSKYMYMHHPASQREDKLEVGSDAASIYNSPVFDMLNRSLRDGRI